MKTFLHISLLFCTFGLFAQPQTKFEVGGNIEGSNVIIGNDNTIYYKSPEYAELKQRLTKLEADIAGKAEWCERCKQKNFPGEVQDSCRAELNNLIAQRDETQEEMGRYISSMDSLQKEIDKDRFGSEQWDKTKRLFREGKIREAERALDLDDIQRRGEPLLDRKQSSDSILQQVADELYIKALLRLTDFTDSMRFDSAVFFFDKSRRYVETVEHLWRFSMLLRQYNQTHRVVGYMEAALRLTPHDTEEEANVRNDLGGVYMDMGITKAAERMYRRALEIYEQLSETDSIRFKPNEAMACMNLGVIYKLWNDPARAEEMYLRSLNIQERLVLIDSAKYEPELAIAYMNLGNYYSNFKSDTIKLAQAEKMYRRSVEIREKLTKVDPEAYEPDLALTYNNLAVLYKEAGNAGAAEQMYLRTLEIKERLTQKDSARFAPDLALTLMNLANFYKANLSRYKGKTVEIEKMYRRSINIYEKFSKFNPAQFEPNLAQACMNMGIWYRLTKKPVEADKMYRRSQEIYERFAKAMPQRYNADLALNCLNYGNYFSDFTDDADKINRAEEMYRRALEIYNRLSNTAPEQFEPLLAWTYRNTGNFYFDIKKMAESEKMYLYSLEIMERLANNNPARFEPDLAETLHTIGYFRYANGQFEEAGKMCSRALALRWKAVANGQINFWNDLDAVYALMGALRDSLESRGDWTIVVAIQQERATCMEALMYLHRDLVIRASSDYGSLSWYYLFTRQYTESQAAAERALSLDATLNLVRVNLGHSYLLRGDWEKAKQIYERYIAGEQDPAEAKKTLETDWDDLEKAGVTHKDVEKARKWVRE